MKLCTLFLLVFATAGLCAAAALAVPLGKEPVAARPAPARRTKAPLAKPQVSSPTPIEGDSDLPPDNPEPGRLPAETSTGSEEAALAEISAQEATQVEPEAGSTSAASAPAASTSDAKRGDRYELRYKFQPNETIRSEVVHRATVETTIKGTTQTAETRTTSIKIWRFSPASTSEQIRFVHGVESIDMWQHTKGREEVTYNSQNDETPPPGYEDVAKAVGVPLTELTIDSRGQVIQRKELHAQSSANPAPLTMPLPKRAVAVGESWIHPLELDVRLTSGALKKIEARQKFTLKKVASGVATIQVESDAITPINDPAIEAQVIQRLASGSVRFDVDAGRVIGQQMDVDKRVIGFNGPASSMHYLSRFTEEFKSATAETVAQPKKGRATR